MTGGVYELVFEGVIESSVEVEDNIKLVLMADHGMSFEQASAILRNAPVVLSASYNVVELSAIRTLLRRAGGRVSIRRLPPPQRPAVLADVLAEDNKSMPQKRGRRERSPAVGDEQLDAFLKHLQSNKQIDLKRYRIVDRMHDVIAK